MPLGIPNGQPNQLERRGVLASQYPHTMIHITLDVTTALDNVGGHTPTSYLREGLILTRITANGQYGRYDAGATDGRQLFANAVVLEHDVDMSVYNADLPVAAIESGVLIQDRLLFNGTPDFGLCQRLIRRKVAL
jgi:hypothetical protein